jgi:hypothetical protein
LRFEPFEASARLRSQEDGAGELNQGVGVAVILERTSPGSLEASALPQPALVRIEGVELLFDPFQA